MMTNNHNRKDDFVTSILVHATSIDSISTKMNRPMNSLDRKDDFVVSFLVHATSIVM